MKEFATCPNCGKPLAYDPARGGERWMCPACGHVMQIPAPGQALPAVPTSTLAPPVIPDEPVVGPPQKNPLLIWMVVLASLVVFEAGVLIWQSLPRHATWEQVHRQDILNLKSSGEDYAARGEPQRAYDKFRELEDLVEGNPINDPELKAAIAQAGQEQNEMVERIMRQEQEENAQRAAIVSIPQGSATQPAAIAAATQPAAVAATRPVVMLARPSVHALGPPPMVGVDDQQIGQAIANGTQFLLDRFKDYKFVNSSDYPEGDTDALVIYALLQSYNATDDSRLDPRRPFMKMALDALKQLPMDDRYSTYGRSLRASALQLGGRREDQIALDEDLRFLLAGSHHGAYTYGDRLNRFMPASGFEDIWDNSNSQYGLLGVWAAAEAGLSVPRDYWKSAQQHWIECQLPDGQWAYTQGDGSPRVSMNMAGLASLLVTQDYLSTSRATAKEKDPLAPALAKGMAWLESGNNSVVAFSDGSWPGYTLYGLERVGLASGYKYFGAHDWYRESAANVVASAGPDGGWGSPIPTAFALLFLARGRHPIVMNKLRFEGDWDAHPRDVANLATYSSRMLEQQFNWQVVPASHNWADWTDGPILFISAKDPPPLSPEQDSQLRDYVLNGGLLLTQAEGGSPAMTQWATDLGKRLFAPYDWKELPADHPLWSVHIRLKNRPQLSAITNGARILMIHLPQDVSGLWQMHKEMESAVAGTPSTLSVDHPDELNFGLNLFLYAIGRTDVRNRLVSTAIAPVDTPPAAKITMAQLMVGPDSDPEPAAWPRFSRWFRRKTDLGVDIITGPLDQLVPEAVTTGAAPIAHMTGVTGFTPTAAQAAALRAYVDAGGVVLIDPLGGPNDFLKSVREKLLPMAFAKKELEQLDGTAALLTASNDGMSQLWPLDVRDYVREMQPLTAGGGEPLERAIWVLRSGKGTVVVSSLDITSGLLGCNTWGIAGYTPDFSLALAKNFVLWAWDGAKP